MSTHGSSVKRCARPLLAVVLLFLAGSCSGKSDDVAGPENTIQVVIAGTGSGTVVSDPASIDCPTVCGPIDWTPGAPVRLIATPAGGSTFGGWSGDAGGSNDTCEVMVDGHKVVTATFN